MSSKKTTKIQNILFINNITKLVDKYGSPYSFADKIGSSYESVRKWCLGINMPNGNQLCSMKEKCDISIDWLLAGETPEPVYLKAQEKDRPTFVVTDHGKYGTSSDECPVNCEGNLREICRNVKYVIEDDGEFAEALKANIKAFKKSVELDRRVKNLEKSLSSGQGGGIPQIPARSTARKRKAR